MQQRILFLLTLIKERKYGSISKNASGKKKLAKHLQKRLYTSGLWYARNALCLSMECGDFAWDGFQPSGLDVRLMRFCLTISRYKKARQVRYGLRF